MKLGVQIKDENFYINFKFKTLSKEKLILNKKNETEVPFL